ncbi:MAG: DNA recombination protein RmuC [Actinomycetota bacterium]|nr:DNA recombination protein RmuC [Actinomycetota bacterium]
MGELLIGVLALGLGAGLGAWAVLRNRAAGTAGDGRSALRIEGRLEVQSAELRRLADATSTRDGLGEQLRTEFAGARRALDELSTRERERRDREQEAWSVIRRLATVLAGGSAKGRAGENMLREHLAELPAGMFVSELRVNGKVVEYGLLLPDGRHLPVDSKWSADRELEALEAATDPVERDARSRDVERIVASRAREVAAYLDPALTAPVAVAAVPDAAYAVLRRAHADAFARGVVIVPYSTALPVLLFLYSLVSRFGTAGDVESCLAEIAGLLDGMAGVLENKIARAATMISNGADEFRSQLGKARGSLARGRVSSVEPPPLPPTEEGILKAVP